MKVSKMKNNSDKLGFIFNFRYKEIGISTDNNVKT